ICTTMPVIGSPNAHARNHRVPRSFRATPRKIAHLMILCRTGNPLLFRMTRNSRLMLSICPPLSVGGSKAYTPPWAGRRFRQHSFYLCRVWELKPRPFHYALIHRSACKGNSANFAITEFSEVQANHILKKRNLTLDYGREKSRRVKISSEGRP